MLWVFIVTALIVIAPIVIVSIVIVPIVSASTFTAPSRTGGRPSKRLLSVRVFIAQCV